MPGLVPGIHVLRAPWIGVDGRDKPGHDVGEALVLPRSKAQAAKIARSFFVSSSAITPSADTGRPIR